MGTLIRRAWLAASTTLLLVGALLIGWFVPNDRYDILTVLLVVVLGALGMLFRRLARLERANERAVSFQLRAAETAQAFGSPDWDYAAAQWRETAWDRPTGLVSSPAPLPNVESPHASSVYA